MARQKPNPGSRECGELDAIVVHIFDSLDGAADRNGGLSARPQEKSRARPRPAPWPRDENLGREDASPTGRGPADDTGAPRSKTAAPFPSEPASERTELPDCAEEGPAFEREQQDPSLLVDEDEEKFIEQTVAWLISRPNPDILLDRIWNRLIDMAEDDEARLQRTPAADQRRSGAAERPEG